MELINPQFFFLVKEFEKLKDEQNKRIEFRDHMIYITLGVIGGVFSFIIEKPDYISALLVLPFVCIILGWTYFINDEKVSQIGDYLTDFIIPRVVTFKSEVELTITPTWEEYHKNTHRRSRNKSIQLWMDILLFCITALFSIFSFFYLIGDIKWFQLIFAIIEILLIIFLGYQFIAVFYTRKVTKQVKN